MLRLLLIPVLALGLAACGNDTPAEPADAASAEAPAESAEAVLVGEAPGADEVFFLASDVGTRSAELDGQDITVEGTIAEVCQEAGCWLTLKTDDGTPFRVSVPKDEAGEYVYTFPKNVTGVQAQLKGAFSVTEESVETLRHLAEDAGDSAEAIAAITEPKRTLSLTATGARLIGAPATPTETVSLKSAPTVTEGGERCSDCPRHRASEAIKA